MSIKEEFFKAFNIGKPVMRKWYYDGYYEDFSWEYEDVIIPSALLEEYDNSVEKLNDRIQELKMDDTKYKREIDAVDTEYGKVSCAYMKYPRITDRNILQLMCILNDVTFATFYGCTVEELSNNILKECIDSITKVNWRNRNICVDDYIKQVQDVFKEA